jgi:hypothetical protein
MTDAVNFLGGDAGNDVGLYHFEDLGRKATRHPHFSDFLGRFDGNAH